MKDFALSYSPTMKTEAVEQNYLIEDEDHYYLHGSSRCHLNNNETTLS